MGRLVRFDCFEVDLAAGQVRKGGQRVPLREQCFQVLDALLERPGEVVTRDELRRRLWPTETFGDLDSGLNSAVAQLRAAFGDAAERPRYVETLPRRGYRFLAEVAVDAPPPPPSRPSRPRLVVLPFVNLGGDPAQEHLSDAMTEEVITELGAVAADRLGLIARTTAMRYKGSPKDASEIADELGVEYLVEGSVRPDGDRFTATVQLIRARDQTHLFAERYESHLHGIFDVRSAIAEAVAACLADADRAEPAPRPRARRRKPTDDLVAWNAYVQGRHAIEAMTAEAFGRARGDLELALSRDPGFALAHDALAELYSYLGYFGVIPPKEAFSVGISHALAAVELDDSLAEAHALLAEYHKQLDFNWAGAERQMARALELDPDSPIVRIRHVVAVLMPQNRLDQGLAEVELALQSDPLSPLAHSWEGVLLVLARQYDLALEQADRYAELEPASPWPHFIRGVANRQKYAQALREGRVCPELAERAIDEHRKTVELAPGTDTFVGWLGLALGVCGRESEARAVLRSIHDSGRYNLPTTVGQVHLGLGEIDAAFEWFDRAVDERDQMMMAILSYAHFDPIRGDPRFAGLLRKMKLA